MIIGITVNLTRKNAYAVTLEVIKELKNLQFDILMSDELKDSFSDYDIEFTDGELWVEKSDIIISIGGDGTFIHASHFVAKYDKPILGINAGNLGFLTGLEKTELSLLKKLATGDYYVDNRMMICCEIYKNNELVSKSYSLNDVVIARGEFLRMCKITLTVDGTYSNSYVADGLIFSTPTGSTAYNLSAGGPVLDPTIESIIVTPICTHTVFNRAIIFRPDSKIEVTVDNVSHSDAVISLDGEDPIKLSENEKIIIRRGNRRVKVIRLKSDSFTNILQNKLTKRRTD